MNTIAVKLLRQGAKLPTYGSTEAAGADLYACLTEYLYGLRHLFGCMATIQESQTTVVKGLCSHAYPIHTELLYSSGIFWGYIVRIYLNSDLCRGER